MATGKINITGAQGGRGPNNQTPVRMELSSYLTDPDRKNLLLLGIEKLQARPVSDMKSWYQLAGIHGQPYTPWDGEANSSGRKPGGYCAHSSIMFLSWHRPYLAIYEQALYEDVQAVVKTFPAGAKRDKLAKVALTFRIPYWDWAASTSPHSILTQKVIEVEKATGKTTIPNPLYSYKFQTLQQFPATAGPYKTWRQTVRHPTSNAASAESDANFVQDVKTGFDDRQLGGQFFDNRTGVWLNVRERVWQLLNSEQNKYPTYAAFSNNQWVSNGMSSDYDSLEAVHDSVHVITGGGGHMSHPGYAGFDPLFWLHHCNVDRMWALWQALHPEADLNWEFGQRAETVHPFHWWVPNGGVREEENTPLVPFHKTNTQYWDSNGVRDFKVMGYTYPELTEWNTPGVSRQQLKSKVSVAVKKLYGNRTTSGALLEVRSTESGSPFVSLASVPSGVPPLEKKAAPVDQKVLAQNPPQAAGATSAAATAAVKAAPPALKPTDKILSVPVSKLVKNGTHREYFCNIRVPKYRFDGSFVVHVFIGEFSANPQERPHDKNLVGSTHVFANNISTTGCENCKANAEKNLLVTGSVPLTSALLERINHVGSLEIADVEPYLKENLHWRIHRSNSDHDNIDRRTVEDVLVTVTSAIVVHPSTPDGLPVYRDWNPIPGITEGRPTGAGYDNAEGYQS